MPKTYTIQTYQYTELGDKAKKKALQVMQDAEAEHGDCSGFISDHFTERLDDLGYPTDRIEFSLSSCQGDGVAFYGTLLLSDTFLSRCLVDSDTPVEDLNVLKQLRVHGDLVIKVVRNQHGHHYSHSNTMYLDVNYTGDSELQPLIEDLEDWILADIRSTSKALEAEGYAIIADARSDETVIENAAANETEFTIDGRFAYLARLNALLV